MRKGVLLSVLLSSAVALLYSQTLDSPRLEMKVGFERPDGSHAIQNIPLETYVARVLVGEAAPQSPPAALEALAIAIRTFAVVNRNRHGAEGFDVCDTTHCQVLRIATTATERAAGATAGLVLMQAGTPVPVYYSASCGGRTEVPSAVWPNSDDPPYLPSQPDDACEGQPQWAAELKTADLTKALKAAGFRGDRLREMRVISRNASGRVSKLRVDGFSPDTISGQDFRAAIGPTLGWLLVKSAAFEMERHGDVYHLEGRGYGHGVGMCVIGSVNLAARGQTAAQILGRYYPGLDIVPLVNAATVINLPVRPISPARTAAAAAVLAASPAPSPIALALPVDDEGERSTIDALALRARDDIAKDLGVTAPAHVTIRFHPTTQSYERATGQAWFTSGAIVAGDIHLLPVAVLRDRGVLERTVRHELVHLMLDEPLLRRPAWVREGAAMYFSGQRPDAAGEESKFRPRSRLSCPEDAELLQPVSAGSLSNAHSRALACFARQAGDGKSWRDVK
jgi:stage II sporulation protein D (peptidoglycan lytic transglycosylase)